MPDNVYTRLGAVPVEAPQVNPYIAAGAVPLRPEVAKLRSDLAPVESQGMDSTLDSMGWIPGMGTPGAAQAFRSADAETMKSIADNEQVARIPSSVANILMPGFGQLASFATLGEDGDVNVPGLLPLSQGYQQGLRGLQSLGVRAAETVLPNAGATGATDELNRGRDLASSAQSQSLAPSAIKGTAASLTQMALPGRYMGPMGAIATGALTSANESYTQALDRFTAEAEANYQQNIQDGVDPQEASQRRAVALERAKAGATTHSLVQGSIEGFGTYLFGKLFGQGVEGLFGKAMTGATFKQAAKEALKNTAAELGEEYAVGVSQKLDKILEGVDDDAVLDKDSWIGLTQQTQRELALTGLQAAGMTGTMSVPSLVQGEMNEQAKAEADARRAGYKDWRKSQGQAPDDPEFKAAMDALEKQYASQPEAGPKRPPVRTAGEVANRIASDAGLEANLGQPSAAEPAPPAIPRGADPSPAEVAPATGPTQAPRTSTQGAPGPYEGDRVKVAPPKPRLTPAAKALLDNADQGKSMPMFVSNQMKQIAAENGIEVTDSMGPGAVIDALREKESEEVEVQPEPAPAPVATPSSNEKQPWEMTREEATAQGWGENWPSVIRRNIEYGKPVPESVLTELSAYDSSKSTGTKSATAKPASTGDKVIRYTHKDGTGLLNNNGLDRSKLTDDEEAELVELMDLGLQQPPSGTIGTFYFTEDGERKHARMLELLTKASRKGAVRTESVLESEPTWQSTDGQIAAPSPNPSAFTPKAAQEEAAAEKGGRYSIYEINTSQGPRWAIQNGDKPGMGDEVYPSRQEAESAATRKQVLDKENAEFAAKEQSKKDAAKAAKDEEDKQLTSFLGKLPAMQGGKVRSTLEKDSAKRINSTGEVLTGPRWKIVETLIARGYRPEEYDGKPILKASDGAFFDTTKAEHDFAAHLLEQQSVLDSPPAPASPSSSGPKLSLLTPKGQRSIPGLGPEAIAIEAREERQAKFDKEHRQEILDALEIEEAGDLEPDFQKMQTLIYETIPQIVADAKVNEDNIDDVYDGITLDIPPALKRDVEEYAGEILYDALKEKAKNSPWFDLERNGWKITKEGEEFVLRYPDGQERYRSKGLWHVQDVADEAKPDIETEEAGSELDRLRAESDKMYDEIEALQNAGKDREANALIEKEKPIRKRISELEAPFKKAEQEAKAREQEARNKKTWSETEQRVAEAPVHQRRNGWEIVKDGANYVLRDPNDKTEIYRGKLSRVREVADESKPDDATKEVKTEAAQEKPVEATPSPGFTRTSPAKGTPERAELDAKYDKFQAEFSKANEDVDAAFKAAKNAKFGSKKEEQAMAKLTKAKDRLAALDRSVMNESRVAVLEDAVENAKDEFQRGFAIERLNDLLASLGIKRREKGGEKIYDRAKAAGEAEAKRLGMDDETASKIGFDYAQALNAFGRDTLQDYVAKQVMIHGEEADYRKAVKELDGMEVSGRSDYRRNLDSSRRDPEGVKRVMDEARKEVSEKKKAEKMAAEMDKEASISRAKSLKPLELKGARKDWSGNVVEDGDLLSDGRAIVVKSSVSTGDATALSKMSARHTNGMPQAKVQKLMDSYVDGAGEKAEILGVLTYGKDNDLTAAYLKTGDSVAVADPEKLSYLLRVTGADEIRLSSGKSELPGLVLYKSGDPVALFLTLDKAPTIDLASAPPAQVLPPAKKSLGAKKPAKAKKAKAKVEAAEPNIEKMTRAERRQADPTKQTLPVAEQIADAEQIAAQDIAKTWERLFDVPIREGGFGSVKRAAAIYKRLSEVVRHLPEFAANLAVLSHEIGHHIDNKTDTRKMFGKLPYLLRVQLKLLDYDPVAGRMTEGWAEFIRHYITEGDTESLAPQLHEWFEKEWMTKNPVWADRIRQARVHSMQYANQGAWKRVASAFGKPGQDMNFGERLKSNIKGGWMSFMHDWVDRGHVLQVISDKLKSMGADFTNKASPYVMWQHYLMSARAMSSQAIDQGVHALTDGRKLGPSLWGKLRDNIRNSHEYDEAIQFALARHKLFMDQINPRYNASITTEDARAIVASVQVDPEKLRRYEAVAKHIAEYGRSTLDMLVDAGALGADERAKMVEKYGDYYFPMMRAKDQPGWRAMFNGGRFVNLPKSVKGRSEKGSGLKVLDPIDQLMGLTMERYAIASQTRVAHNLASWLDPQLGGMKGWGGMLDRIDPKTTMTEERVGRILKQLVDGGFVDEDEAKSWQVAHQINSEGIETVSEKNLAWFAEYHDLDPEDFGGMEEAAQEEPDISSQIAIYKHDFSPDPAKAIVRISMPDGTKVMYEMDRYLHDVATGASPAEMGIIKQIAGTLTQAFKTGATGLSTGFGLGNLMIDYIEYQGRAKEVQGAATLTKPGEMLGRVVMHKLSEKYGKFFGVDYVDPLIREYEKDGGKIFTRLGMDIDNRKRVRRKSLGLRPGGIVDAAWNLKDRMWGVVESAQDFMAWTDAPPRLAEMEGAAKRMGYQASKDGWVNMNTGKTGPLPENVRAEMMYAAGEATTNFKRFGTEARKVETFLPYTTATIASLHREAGLLYGLKDIAGGDQNTAAKRYALYLMATAAASAVYWAMRAKDRDYEEADQDVKDRFWTFGWGGKTVAGIPKPRDAGRLVANLTESVLDVIYKKDPRREPMDVVSSDLIGRVPVGGGPLKSAAEVMADWDFYRNRPLTPASIERNNVPIYAQSTPYTLELNKLLGRMVHNKDWGLSPIQTQHLMNGFTGGGYGRNVDTAESLLLGVPSVRNIPFVRGVMIDRFASGSIDDFYNEIGNVKRQLADDKITGSSSKKASDRYSILAEYDKLMGMIRAEEKLDIRGRRTGEFEPYLLSLALEALGRKGYEDLPSPFDDPDAPEAVKEIALKFTTSKAETAILSSGMPIRTKDDTDEEFNLRVQNWKEDSETATKWLESHKDTAIGKQAIQDVKNSKTYRNLMDRSEIPKWNIERGERVVDHQEELTRWQARYDQALKWGE